MGQSQKGRTLSGIDHGGGTKAEHNAVMKVPQSSQVACKTDDSQMKCQLSRPRPGSTHACQSHSSPRNRSPTGKDAPGDCKGGSKGLGHGGHCADKKTLAVERNDHCSMTQDRSKGIVAHADAEAMN